MPDSQSRSRILRALRVARRPFPNTTPAGALLPVVPRATSAASALAQQFMQQAIMQGAQAYRASGREEGLQMLLELLRGQTLIAAWELELVGLPGLAQALSRSGIQVAEPRDANPEVGLTGAMAGLAATGSLLLSSGAGCYRSTSLLPPVHIAVLYEEQLFADLESWFAAQRRAQLQRLRQASNILIITGPSRTADIAMELVLGMHGPRELHILLVAPDG